MTGLAVTDAGGTTRAGRTAGAVLVVAKAPVPGLAKTRLAARVGESAAADVAACALLDVLHAVPAAGARLLVAMSGDLDDAARAEQVRAALEPAAVFAQRGADFADRLAHAHADARTLAAEDEPILQVGMDTPQLSPSLIVESLRTAAVHDAVLGLAEDGGWWGLAVRDAGWAETLRDVPMSRDDTGELTLLALRGLGIEIALLPPLRDVDTWEDAQQVARLAPASRFAAAVTAAARVAGSSDQPPARGWSRPG